MKKVFALLMVGTMVSLAACQEKKAESSATLDSASTAAEMTEMKADSMVDAADSTVDAIADTVHN